MKRYQNPDVFEPLAMAYALGTLQGRARARFETLMSQHFYLRVVTEAYEHQFAGLAGLLPPEEPSPQVWQRLEAELGLQQKQSRAESNEPKKASKWLNFSEWFHWPAMAFASVLAAVVTVFVMNNAQPDAYIAKLESIASESFALATVDRKDMSITVAMAGDLGAGDGVQPTLWCLSKNPDEEPIRMGTLKASGETQLSISADMFQGLQDVSQFAITLEPVDNSNAGPAGEQILVGDLMRGKE